jgi:cysteine-rich repeat protein
MLRISRAATVRLLLLLSLCASSGGVEAASGLGFLQSLPNNLGQLDHLRGVSALAVSPDGKNVYAAATDDDSLIVFSRSTQTGLLSFLEAQIDNTGAIDGIDSVKAVAVTPDGADVYAAASRDDAVAVFRRDPASGALTFVERKRDGVDGVDGLNGADAIAVSPDNLFVYVGGADDDAIAVFARNPATGALTFIEVQRNGMFGVSGLSRVRAVTVSADGAHVYAAASRDDSLTVFRRNVTTGALTFIERQRDSQDVGGVDGLDSATAVVVSPDGKHVYAAGTLDDAVALFSRDAATGALAFVSVVREGVAGVDGLFGVKGLAMAPDGLHLYAASADDNAVTVFERDATTGALTFAGTHPDGVGDVMGLAGAQGVALGPEGNDLYVAGATSDAVTVFSTHCADGTLDPDEQCDDGNTAAGDGCSAGCRLECSSATSCDDADTCTEQRCRGGECSNPRCGLDGSLCALADNVPALEDEPTCAPMPPKLRRAIIRRINRAGRRIQAARRRRNPDFGKLVQRVSIDIAAIGKRAERLEKHHRIPVECRDAAARSISALSDSLADMLLHRQSCAP